MNYDERQQGNTGFLFIKIDPVRLSLRSLGYECKTTFPEDFGVADDYHKSEDGVRDTFNRAFEQYKDDRVYGTELAMVLNHKAWQHADTNRELSVLYTELFHKLDTYILDNWNKEDLKYYLEITD